MFDLTEYKTNLNDAVHHFQEEMKKVRTGRAHPDMLSGVKVEVYGQLSPLKQVANITVADATLLTITPFDPSTLQPIITAIRSDTALGLNPTDDGRVVRVPIPPLTQERREEIIKNTGTQVENAKVALRHAREEIRKALKAAALPEDVAKRAEKEIDDLLRTYTTQIDDLFKAKSAEILKI